ncbi:MAG: molecular chaperone DnaJ [Candidatus Margulisiibacteriota bacterium]
MPQSKDYYQVLGIQRNASQDEIKSAFRRLARQYHPDVCKEPGTIDKFKEINEAYQVLGDQKKKSLYDTYGQVGFGAGSAGVDFSEINLEDLFGGISGFGGFGDVFETFFGGGTSRRQKTGPQRGTDLRYDMSITLEESYTGIEKEIDIQHLKSCIKCKGTGAEPGSQIKKCSACSGAGSVKHTQRTILGSFSSVVPCVACQGTGEKIESPCKSCKGAGRTRSESRIKVHVPAGIDNGYRLRISDSGDAGLKGAPSGDLYVFISVKPHSKFKRQGDNLITVEKIDFVSAILGDEITIMVLNEKTSLKIPPGTQPNTVIKLKGKGMPRINSSGYGDLFVEVQVQIPTRLSKTQIDLLKKIKGI